MQISVNFFYLLFIAIIETLNSCRRRIRWPTGKETLRRVCIRYLQEKQRETIGAAKESETERINRYRDTASMQKPTGQQFSEGASLVEVLEEEMVGMHREQVARLPTFQNLQRREDHEKNSRVSSERARIKLILGTRINTLILIRNMQNNASLK